MLRDRLVCRINNSKIQQKLLPEKTLTLASAIETAQGMEMAARNSKELAQHEGASASPSTAGVHRVTPPKRRKDTGSKFHGTCFCWGRVGHKRENCRLKDAVCRGCGNPGHLIRVWRNKSAAKRGRRKPLTKNAC